MIRLLEFRQSTESRKFSAAFSLNLIATILLLIAGLIAQGATASQLDFTIFPSDPVVEPGQTIVFNGMITNTTGTLLSTTDLAITFSGFDPAVLLPNQLIGSVVFDIPDLSISPNVDLFSILVHDLAPAGTYSIEVLLVDINNNLSDPALINFTVMPIPIPAGIALFVSALIAVFSRPKFTN